MSRSRVKFPRTYSAVHFQGILFMMKFKSNFVYSSWSLIGSVAKIIVLLDQTSCAWTVSRGISDNASYMRKIEDIVDSCRFWKQILLSALLFVHNDTVFGGHVRYDSGILPNHFGLVVTSYNLPTREAANWWIEAALRNLKWGCGACPWCHAIKLVYSSSCNVLAPAYRMRGCNGNQSPVTWCREETVCGIYQMLFERIWIVCGAILRQLVHWCGMFVCMP